MTLTGDVATHGPAGVGGIPMVASVDLMTNLATRPYVELRLATRLEELRRYRRAFGVLLAIVDDADRLVAAHPEQQTEQMFQQAARAFAASLRPFDVVGRWDRAELIALATVQQYSDLYAIGERVRTEVEKAHVLAGGEITGVTLSIGATAAEGSDTPKSLVERVRLWAQRSAAEGGNRVSF